MTTTTTTAPTLSVVEFDAEVQERIASVAAHAAACGKLECGHTARSTDPDARRAVFLYSASAVMPEAVADALASERPAVAAMYGELQKAGVYAPRYVKRTTAGGQNTYALQGGEAWMPQTTLANGQPIPVTDERATVWGAMIRGESLTSIARNYPSSRGGERSVETVKSHAGWLRRRCAAHDSTSALIALIAAGRFDLRGNRLTTDAEARALLAPQGESPVVAPEDTPEAEDSTEGE